MNLGVLFSGGKDSTLAMWMAQQNGGNISCLISVVSENKESYMFHTPSIKNVKIQAKSMGFPIIVKKTKGVKEEELKDLENVIKKAKKQFNLNGIVTGAVKSVYQGSRIAKICKKLELELINPLWGMDEKQILQSLVENKFKVVIVGVFAYPLDNKWLGRIIDENYIKDVEFLSEKWGVSMAGEGGEFESFVLESPLFNKKLIIKSFKDFGEKNSWSRELILRFEK